MSSSGSDNFYAQIFCLLREIFADFGVGDDSFHVAQFAEAIVALHAERGGFGDDVSAFGKFNHARLVDAFFALVARERIFVEVDARRADKRNVGAKAFDKF